VATADVAGTARTTAKAPNRTSTTETHERREADGVPEHVRVDDVTLNHPDGHEYKQGDGNDVERLWEADCHDEEPTDEGSDHGDDLDEADEAADEQPVVEADGVEARREHEADGADHQKLDAGICAEPPVDLQVGRPRLRPLRLGCECCEQLDHAVAFGDPVPGRREREEEGDDGVGRLVTIRRDGVEDRAPGRQVAEVRVEPDEDVMSDARRMGDGGGAEVRLRERLLELV
jgi:hypothetical protein